MIDRYRLRTRISELLARISIVCAVAGLMPALAYAEGTTGLSPVVPDGIPVLLQVPDGHVFRFHAFAAGTQNYECRSDATGTTGWVFRQPKAVLLGDDGEPIGIHGRGPFWTGYDGSQVIGAAPISAPGRDSANDVPWLLLRGAPGETDGRFAHVSYIQRLDTHGGLPPAGPCDPYLQPNLAVPYVAVYYFYTPIEGAHPAQAPNSLTSAIQSSLARSDCWASGDMVGDSNPAQVYATLCGVSGSPRRGETRL